MTNSVAKQGVLAAVMAYLLWGIAPVYFKWLEAIAATDILIHRVIWSFVTLAAFMSVLGLWHRVRAFTKQPQKWWPLACAAILLGLNWLIFIWAILNDRVLEASLGYYINPLLNVALAMLLFSERLHKAQLAAVLLACSGVLVQLIVYGSLPWVALLLATTFSSYSLLKKKLKLDATTGLFLESGVLLPFALIYLLAWDRAPVDNFIAHAWLDEALLVGLGLVTTVPLLFFNAAASRISLVTLGFLQYIGPSLMFLQAVFVFEESLSANQLLTFGFIWAALAVFSWHAWRQTTINQTTSVVSPVGFDKDDGNNEPSTGTQKVLISPAEVDKAKVISN